MELDKKAITPPKIKFSESALLQLKLILENDFTLMNKYFRIQITGKGCDGFSYSTGFTDLHEDDFKVLTEGVEFLIDPFSAYYLQDSKIDYVQDFENEEEGFVVTNNNQGDFAGKFWREAPGKIPPLIKDKI